MGDVSESLTVGIIPLFQRGCVWTLAHQVQSLWQDIVDRVDALREHRENARKAGSADKLKPLKKHFLGVIIVSAPPSLDKGVPTREIIDGQQRTTTLQIRATPRMAPRRS